MPTKTISLEIDAYDLLKGAKLNDRESFSQVVRRVLSDQPVMTAGELLKALEPLEGIGAGPRRVRKHGAA